MRSGSPIRRVRVLHLCSYPLVTPSLGVETSKMVELTKNIVRELLDYDKLTGKLTWKFRDRKWFKTTTAWKIWNTRFAGKQAFTRNSRGRYFANIFGKSYLAHRIIFLWMRGRWPDPEVDHEDQDPGNNRWNNLKESTHLQNMRNRKRHVNNKTGVSGVCEDKHGYIVKIGTVYVGRFKSFAKAVSARRTAEKDYGYSPNHGQ
jgi:HNH endonuclease